jgi:uncharacterized protein (DUF302 family)
MEQTTGLAKRVETKKSFTEACAALTELCPERMFRVLAEHDVQATLSERGFEREPLKIIEVCNAGFADKALKMDQDVSLFMPCKFVVAENNGATSITLGRPTMISEVLDSPGLTELAAEVEERLTAILDEVAE